MVRSKAGDDCEVLVLPVDIAAFITPRMLRNGLQQAGLDWDLILVPGSVGVSFQGLEEEFGVKIRLGPRHAWDIDRVLPYVGRTEFSHTTPACQLLEDEFRRQTRLELARLEASAIPVLNIRGVKIGGGSRMKVLAEVVGATRLEKKALLERVKYFLESGADMIDLGIPLDATPGEVRRTVEAVRGLKVPVSVDTLDPGLLEAGIQAGASLVLSLNSSNLEVASEMVKQGVPGVVIPGEKDIYQNLEEARSLGVQVIADPVLEPLGQGLLESLERYHEFRRREPETPLFFGLGNVTELVDVDSTGVNGLLAGLAMEIRADILFTPEHSHKTRGSVSELRQASEMMHLAQNQGRTKDLGIDLLILKEKRRRPGVKRPSEYIKAERNKGWHPDPRGSFQIALTESGEIAATFRPKKQGEPQEVIIGTTAREVLDTILNLGLASTLEHVAYLGVELARAEIALKLGRSYMQDDRF